MKTIREIMPEEILVSGLADVQKLKKERAEWQRRMKFIALEDRIQKWIEQDRVNRSVSLLSGEATPCAVLLIQVTSDEAVNKEWIGEGASYAEAFEIAFQKWEVDLGNV